jgi:hypothetical protein
MGKYGFEISGKVQIYDVHNMCECVWQKDLLFSIMHDMLWRWVMVCPQHVLILWTWYTGIVSYMLEWMACYVCDMQHNTIIIGGKCFRILSTPGSCFCCIFRSSKRTATTYPCMILWFTIHCWKNRYCPWRRDREQSTPRYYQCCISVIPILSRCVADRITE